jgi:hypothetical protein
MPQKPVVVNINHFRIFHKTWQMMIYITGFKYVNDRIIQIYYNDEDGDPRTTSAEI